MTRNELLGQLKRGNFNMLKQFPGLSSDETLMLDAYILNPEIYKHIDQSLLGKESFFYELASINPELIKGTPYAGKKDFMKKLISAAPMAAKFMQKRLYDDPIFVMEIATKTEAGEIIIEAMKNDPGIKSELQRLGFEEYKHVDNYDVSRQREMISRGEITPELANNEAFMTAAIAQDLNYIDKLGEKILADPFAFGRVYEANLPQFDQYNHNVCVETVRGNKTDDEVKSKLKHQAKVLENEERQEQDKIYRAKKSQNEARIKSRYEKLAETTDEEKRKKLLSELDVLVKQGERIEAAAHSPEAMEELLASKKDTMGVIGKESEEEKAARLELEAAEKRLGIINLAKVKNFINNEEPGRINAVDRFFKKNFRVLIDRLKEDMPKDSEEYKAMTNSPLEYMSKHSELLDKITEAEARGYVESFIEKRKKALEFEENENAELEKGKKDPTNTTEASVRKVQTDISEITETELKNECIGLKREIEIADTVDEKSELSTSLTSKMRVLENKVNGKNASTVEAYKSNSTNPELKKLMEKENQLLLSTSLASIREGKAVSLEDIKKAKKGLSTLFAEEFPEVEQRVQNIFEQTARMDTRMSVVEYIARNPKVFVELSEGMSENRVIEMQRRIDAFGELDDYSRGIRKPKVIESAAKENLDNENTRDEEEEK